MGKKIKIESDPNLAKSHEAGAIVELTQPALHSQFGLVHYLSFQIHIFQIKIAEKYFKDLENSQGKILEAEIKPGNMRLITDPELLMDIYQSGLGLMVNTHLAFDCFLFHALLNVFKEDPIKVAELNSKEWDTIKKLGVFLKLTNNENLINSDGYTAFIQIKEKRDAFSHINSDRYYNAKDGEWDEVPLAWIVSGKYKNPYKKAVVFLEELMDIWDKEKSKYDKPGEISGLVRGVSSLHSVKNPPKSL
ncbi:MAG: hypothetical protein KIH67_001910 [Candidatus Moranbacteria bacterium]|nr:hypothetical protein [Candidatus Moranbacteria bacterium]